ncbi:MAG TPA: protocatechuate 3,4-dioxygenase [Pirellulaceae bacterium]|nr:protocatechuate 3,4-dioxygenase [Pirellulaceae bacterium]
MTQSINSRRRFLTWGGASLGVVAVGFSGRWAWGEHVLTAREFQDQLVRTPAQTEGPFYPNRLPLDTDNDLIIINENLTPAVGEITHLTGRVFDANGKPVRNAQVEIWQVDHRGAYLHHGSANHAQRDTNFQGFGRCLTTAQGDYYFRTIKPVPYPGRTPHIHFKIRRGNQTLLITQCYVKGHELNARDGVLNSIRDPQTRDSVIVDFAALPDSKIGELAAKFDIVLGVTPSD